MPHQIITYPIQPADAGRTLLELATALAPDGAEIVRRGGAWLDGRRAVAPDAAPPPGATLALRRPPAGGYAEVAIGPADIAYEDAWLIVLHKAAGWYVGATPWDVHGNALAALGRFLAARDGGAPPVHLAHQLDRDTSGLLLISKSPAANGPLQAAFAGELVEKGYVGVCAGVPDPPAGELRTGHGRAAGGRWRLYPLEELGRALPEGGGRVRLAHTAYAVERSHGDAALLRLRLHTGRTHQIRLHLAHLGHPLLGDTRYGGPASYRGRALPGHLLHAATLSLPHPITGARLALQSEARFGAF